MNPNNFPFKNDTVITSLLGMSLFSTSVTTACNQDLWSIGAPQSRLERQSRQTQGTIIIQKEYRWETQNCENSYPNLVMASNTNESELFIQKQLKEVYEGRLQKIDDELGADGTEVKISVT